MDEIKKSEDLLDRIQGLLDNAKKQGHIIVRVEDIENTFPELKEMSEDEKTREEIVKFIQMEVEDEIVGNKWIAWLEKQAEHANFRNKIQIGDKVTRNEAGILVNISQLNRIAKPRVTNKIEPKFHEGDWVVHTATGITHQIKHLKKDVTSKTYGYSLVDDGYISCYDEANYHLWNIKDAKDGDIIQLGKVTAIFQEYICGEHCKCYCSVYDGEFEIPTQDDDDNCYGCHDATPATKEQREILFQKMKEAGYEWNSEKKKKLKKLHIIDEGKAEMDYCFTNMMNDEKVKPQLSTPMSNSKELEERMYEACNRFFAPNTDPNKYSASDLFYAGVKAERDLNMPAWSEEDYNRISSIKYLLHELDNHNFDDWFDKIKSLKPQPKQEWSEEDINNLNRIVEILVEGSRIQNWWRTERLISKDEMEKLTNWLKFIYHKQWKPSGE